MLGSASTPEGLLKEVCPLPEPHLDDRRGGSGEGLGFLGSHVPGKEGSGSQGDLEKSWVPARTGGSEPGHRAVEPVGRSHISRERVRRAEAYGALSFCCSLPPCFLRLRGTLNMEPVLASGGRISEDRGLLGDFMCGA